MYIQFLILWLYFQTVHSEMTRCQIGGLHDEDICKTLIDESVLNRYYIGSFECKITGNEKNKYDVYDKPYKNFEENTNSPTVEQKKNVWMLALGVLKSNVNKTFEDSDTESNIILFKQSLLMQESKYNYSEIDTNWNKVVSTGTDIYRLKFHNKVVSMIEKGEIMKLSNNDLMVLIKSYYNAASTYYFLRKYTIADKVIKEGLEFLRSVENQINDDINTINNLKVWNELYLTLEKDIQNYYNNIELSNELPIALNTVSSDELNDLSPAVLLYRKCFLDNENVKKTELKNASKKFESSIHNNFYLKLNDEKKFENLNDSNISMYYYLMGSYLEKIEDKVKNIIEAIRRPVLSIEDRLLNYEANKLALDMFKDYLREETCDERTSSQFEVCKELQNRIRCDRKLLEDTIIPKLRNEFYVMSCKEKITTDIYISLTTMDYKIDQKALHAIVTSAIDFINTKPEEYKKNNQNIKLAIDILEIYVKVQSKKLKEDKKNKTNDDSQLKKNHPSDDKTKSPSESKPLKTKSDINSENKQQQNERVKNLSKNIDYYMEAPYETKYSEKHTRKRNIFYALIWLAELNGVLCNNLEDNILDYETALNKYINEAYEFGEKYYVMNHINKNDTHLTYLKHKYQAKKLYTKSRWEMSTWPGGWVSSPSTSLVQINHCQILNALTLNDVSSRVNDYLNYIKNGSYFQFINKIELNILLYRNVKNKNSNDFDTMYRYLKDAINEVVITSEDRVRNMEAHELLSRLLMKRNRHEIKMMQKKKKEPSEPSKPCKP